MHRTYIDVAIEQAKKSPCSYKHGSVIVNNKEIISKGYNNYIYSCYSFSKGKITIHAECDSINKSIRKNGKRSLKGSIIYVVRINYNDELKMSKPCKNCQAVIEKFGIKTVYYSTNETDLLQVIKREKIY